MIQRLLSLEPSVFINAISAVLGLAIAAGLVSQANGDAFMTSAGVMIPAFLTILGSILVRERVYPAAKVTPAMSESAPKEENLL